LKFILIDYENRPLKELPTSLPSDVRLVVFLGPQNKNLPTTLVMAVKKLGEQVDLKLLDKGGANALDFVMCFELGRLTKEHESASFILISADTGFQPMVDYCNTNTLKISRFDSLEIALGVPVPENLKLPVPVPPARTPPPAAVTPTRKEPAATISAAAQQKKALASQVTLSGLVEAVREKLDRSKNARPKRLKTLTVKVQEFCGAKVGKTKVAEVIKRLQASGYLAIDDTKVSYKK
jgi:hypothetical protein